MKRNNFPIHSSECLFTTTFEESNVVNVKAALKQGIGPTKKKKVKFLTCYWEPFSLNLQNYPLSLPRDNNNGQYLLHASCMYGFMENA